MSDDLQREKQEAARAWQDYITASDKAAENREHVKETVKSARTAVFASLRNDDVLQIAQEVLAARNAEKLQVQLDAEEVRLGKRFDQILDELVVMQKRMFGSE